MENIPSVIEYRHFLEMYYKYDIDKYTVEARKKEIDKLSDDYLQNIIDNTVTFIIYVLKKIKEENHIFDGNLFTSIDISENFKSIDSNCHGGWPCDTLYNPEDFGPNFWISNRILKSFFKGFLIYIREDESFSSEDEELYSYFCQLQLDISGKIEDFNVLYNSVFRKMNQNEKK